MPQTVKADACPADASSGNPGKCGRAVRLRIWPAVVIVALQVAASSGASFFVSTNVQSAVSLGAIPLAAAILLTLWWLFASRAPVADRVVGLAVFAGALALVVFSQTSRGMGALLLVSALPALTTCAAVVLVATCGLRWPVRRWVLAASLVACTGVFCARRVDSIGGDLAPVASWRWSPTVEARSKIPAEPGPGGTAALPAEAGPADWPGFRGALRDGRVTGVRFSPNWATPPRQRWRHRIGAGWSSFCAVGGYLFTQEQRGGDELVTCYRAATGELVWANRVEARFKDAMGLGPRATPAFHAGRLFAQGATGMLQCLDAATGQTVWKRDLTKDAATRVPVYGFSSSPLVVGDLVLVFTGGAEGRSVMAYECASGAVAWRAGRGTGGYSSPQLATLGGVPQMLIVCDIGMQSFAPATGELFWEHLWKIQGYSRCVQPLVVHDDAVMLGTTGALGSRLLRVARAGAAWDVKEEWTTRKYRPYFNDGVLHKGCGYGFDGERLACLDVKTGARLWEGKLCGGQLLLVADMDLLLILSEAGEVLLVPATPEAFTEAARFKALDGKTWNHPVVADGCLFVRNSDEAACYELP